MNQAVRVGRVFGIDIKLDWSWFLILMLVAWSLATGFFPAEYAFDKATYWILGTSAAILLFVSVLLHELSHSIVAKMHKIKVESITLFFFGGVAGVSPGAKFNPKTEFKMAAAGPAFSLGLGAFFFVLTLLNLPLLFEALFDYLFKINIILGIFNLVPGYPLDGGRIFRAAMWHITKDIKKATYYASMGGKVFGGVLVVLGLVGVFSGIPGGLWYIFIGAFIYFLAATSYKQTILKEILTKIKVESVMRRRYSTIKPTTTLTKFVNLCIYNDKESFIVKDTQVKGVADILHVQKINRKDWDKIKVSQITRPARAVKPSDSIYRALELMENHQIRTLPVKKNKKIIGIVEAKTIGNALRIQQLVSA